MTTPHRYETFVERSMTASGIGTETPFVVDSRTNERAPACGGAKTIVIFPLELAEMTGLRACPCPWRYYL